MWSHEFLEEIARKRQLTKEQKDVFLAKLRGCDRSEEIIAQELNISSDAVRNRWTKIYQKFGLQGQGSGKYGRLLELLTREHEKFNASSGEVSENSLKTTISKPDLNFIGRENAIADLNSFVSQGAKVILIHSKGGVGKTTLAQNYLQQQFGSYIEFPIAKETQNITSVESLIEERLKQLGEEPGREFGVSLDRLKRKLQTARIGVLIDNLEPALDGNGKIIEPHRRYVELLRVLANPEVQSVTLITSRECLRESAVTVQYYLLEGLDVAAWQEFFNSRNVQTDTLALSAMHKAYGGNAKAMEILSSAIQQDYDGNLETYWQANQGDLLIERDLEDLVVCQFNRLQQLNFDAYKLLCRLGCYRYQDVPTVPEEGLFCMLWDVPAAQQRRVIKSLRDRSLVEFKNGEYWLHPMIRAEAIRRLKTSEDWEIANRKAAEFWIESTKTFETLKDAQIAFEAYYHYAKIHDFELAASVLLKQRNNQWEENEYLCDAFYRLGLLEKLLSTVKEIITEVHTTYFRGQLYDLLGEISWITGDIYQAIEYHKTTGIIGAGEIEELKIYSSFQIGLCKIYLWELNEALELLESVSSIARNTEYHNYAVYSWYLIAYISSCLGLKQKAYSFAQAAEEYKLTNKLGALGVGYRWFFLGLTYKNLGEIKKSSELYKKAINYGQEIQFHQIKGMALYGLAELHRKQGDFEKAISHHEQAIEILKQIGAKCEFAEAYYQQALTYKRMGNTQKSQENFDKAIELFREMQAPKQVKKVEQARDSGG
jgi:tetratricopeptide (TPR) repeat protein/DNA-binding CsgD family transcriptional regulator